MSYTPIDINTHYSLKHGYGNPEEYCKLAASYQITSMAICDEVSMSGIYNFYQACKKNNIKPILGVQLPYLDSTIRLYAKNKAGLTTLFNLLYDFNKTGICTFDNVDGSNIVCVIGGFGSIFYNKDADHNSYVQSLNKFIPNLYLGLDLFNNNHIYAFVQTITTQISHELNLPIIPLSRTYHAEKSDRDNFLLLICSREKLLWEDIKTDTRFEHYRDSECHLKSSAEMERYYEQIHVDNSKTFASLFDTIELDSVPQLPSFPLPDEYTDSDEYLLHLCRLGYKKLKAEKKLLSTDDVYSARIKEELKTFKDAGLARYFLIVADYVNWAKQYMMVGPGRGSSVGCLTSYLTGIVGIDPVVNKLFFERFYNAGRNTVGHVSLPDIDTDFPVNKRHMVIDYIREKYGDDCVSQVVTFSELHGRGGLREVLRIHSVCSPKEMDEISSRLPSPDKISDKMEEDKEKSSLKWTLIHQPALMKDWCEYVDGQYTGQYAQYFKQAVELEGRIKERSKHASAIVIAPQILRQIVPMCLDKSTDNMIVAIEYKELEKMGIPKFDILGLSILDKLESFNNLLLGTQHEKS